MTTFLLVNAHKWHPPSPPAALDYVAWELEKAGIASDIVDLSFEEDGLKFQRLIQEKEYDGVCLTVRNLEKTAFSKTLHFPLPPIRELVHTVKDCWDCPVIVGGNGFSILPERILAYLGADYGICGGGEESLPLLVKYLLDGEGTLEQIPSLVYHNGYKTEHSASPHIERNPAPSYERGLPAVKRGYISYQRYFNPGYDHYAGFGNVETKRGCPHQCIYCVEPYTKGSVVRVKPPEAVTQEVDFFLKNGINYLFLTDSEFNSDCDAACHLLDYWIERGYHKKVKWLAYATPSNFSEELTRLLPEAGNLCITVDFSHVSEKMLTNLGKRYTVADIEETISLCQEYQVNFRGSLMLGGPGETRETVKEAIEFFKDVTCEIFLVLGIRVFPNTPLGEQVQHSGPLVDNPNLYGKVVNNEDLFEPVYYISHELGEDAFDYVSEITGDSNQFYTITTPCKITSTLNGHFRGVMPEYETAGHLETRYLCGPGNSR